MCERLLQYSSRDEYFELGNAKVIEALTRISPVAWQHILLNGQNSNEIIDLDALVAGLKLG